MLPAVGAQTEGCGRVAEALQLHGSTGNWWGLGSSRAWDGFVGQRIAQPALIPIVLLCALPFWLQLCQLFRSLIFFQSQLLPTNVFQAQKFH